MRGSHLRDAATLCLAVLPTPGGSLVCELDSGHLDVGEKHRSGCTRWGTPARPVDPRPEPESGRRRVVCPETGVVAFLPHGWADRVEGKAGNTPPGNSA